MSLPTAKDLLAQADRLMRQRTPEELPVLTDLVIEEIELTRVTDRMDDVKPTPARPAWVSSAAAAPAALHAPAPVSAPVMMAAQRPATPPPMPLAAAPAAEKLADVFGVLPRMTHDMPSSVPSAAGPTSVTAMANMRDQFNAQLLTKMEELQHGVYSQVMQQLEIYASGTLKTHLRDKLLPALTDIARDIAEQVAEDTANEVREVVSKAVESEIARLREQLTAKRRF